MAPHLERAAGAHGFTSWIADPVSRPRARVLPRPRSRHLRPAERADAFGREQAHKLAILETCCFLHRIMYRLALTGFSRSGGSFGITKQWL